MKKVLHILKTGGYSGAENVAITIINNYSTEYKGIYLSPQGDINKILAENDIEHYCVDKIDKNSVKNAISEIKPDIIHAHDYTTICIVTLVSKNIKIIGHIHNNVPWMKRISIKSVWFRFRLKYVDELIAVSDAVFSECWYEKKMSKNGLVIGNPICINKIRDKKKGNINSDILFVGRITEQKNPLAFLNIVRKLKENNLTFKAIMLGKGNLQHVCQDYISKYNLENYVEMKGFADNPYDYMNDKSILVITSDWEGFGLVAIEALAFGMPVISTAVGGLTGIVNNECGLCTNNKDTMIMEIKKLLTDKQYYLSKSSNAINRARKLNNIDEYMSKLYEVYEK